MEVLKGPLVTLRLLQESFIKSYLEQFSDEIQKSLLVNSKESEKQYLLECLEKQKDKKTLFYCVFDNNTNQLIGALEIRNPYASRGQLYCWLHQDFWGKGMFAQALMLAADAYFNLTGHVFLNAYVNEHNKQSYNALKKIGFADIGLIKGADDRYYELVLRKQ